MNAIEYFVNCNRIPFIPEYCSIFPKNEQPANRIRGLYKLDIKKVALYLFEKQKDSNPILIRKSSEEIERESVFPANVLDFLLKKKNQHLIPEEWKGKAVFFWGTIYRTKLGDHCIRFLCWRDGKEWGWRFLWLDDPSSRFCHSPWPYGVWHGNVWSNEVVI